ncbi:MAG: hypothetical protein Fur002_07910 [Anaerolineales bacterium]
MKTKHWIISLALAAAAGGVLLQSGKNPEPAAVETAASETLTAEPCAYQWAQHDAPDLSQTFGDLAKNFNPQAEARVSLYGEDCVYADGRSTFGAMETDFYLRIQVEDLANQEALGDWLAQGMEAALKIPREQIQGSYGFVEFWFTKSESEQIIVRVPVQRYLDEVRGKTGAELYRLFSAPTPF